MYFWVNAGCFAQNATDPAVYRSIIVECDTKTVTRLIQAGIKVSTIAANLRVLYYQTAAQAELLGHLFADTQPHGLLWPALDSARHQTGVDLIEAGVGLPRAFTGKGVLLGFIDNGFDFTHPDFLSDSGRFRIRGVWLQHRTGIPPFDFVIGLGLNDSVSISRQGTDDSTLTHGTVVALTASGTGRLTNGQYRGIAPAAELAFVAGANSAAAVLDGIRYLITLAEKLQKPLVIVLSTGAALGPHDGTTLFDTGLNKLLSSGQYPKVVVGGAGNQGHTKAHFMRLFGQKQDSVTTFPRLFFTGSQAASNTIDLWGSKRANYRVKVLVYDNRGRIVLRMPNVFWVNKSGEGTFIQTLRLNAVDSVTVTATIRSSATNLNARGNCRLTITCSNAVQFHPAVMIIGENMTVHGWNEHQLDFSAVIPGWGIVPTATDGDHFHTVNELSGINDHIITVGAYNSRQTVLNLSQQVAFLQNMGLIGWLSAFSSRGPTVDGLTKPNVLAPGHGVVCGISSFLSNAMNPTYVTRVVHNNGRMYFFQAMSGTSIATGIVAGIAALLFEANPTLTGQLIQTIVQQTAFADPEIHAQEPLPNFSYGFGKIQAYNCIQTALSTYNPLRTHHITETITITMYPNPSYANQEVFFRGIKNTEHAHFFDISGRLVYSVMLYPDNAGNAAVTLPDLKAGLFIVKIGFQCHKIAIY